MRARSLTPIKVALATLLALTACSTTPPPQVLPPISFADRPAFRIDAPRIEVVETYVAPLRAPNIEHILPVSPAAMTKAWLRDRLRAQGAGGTFRAIIKEASVTAEDLPKKSGIEGALGSHPSVMLNARLVVTLEFDGKSGASVGVTATVTRSRSLLDTITPAERERAYYDLVKDLGADLDRDLSANLAGPLREATF